VRSYGNEYGETASLFVCLDCSRAFGLTIARNEDGGGEPFVVLAVRPTVSMAPETTGPPAAGGVAG